MGPYKIVDSSIEFNTAMVRGTILYQTVISYNNMLRTRLTAAVEGKRMSHTSAIPSELTPMMTSSANVTKVLARMCGTVANKD
jgi:hypothetical protein